MTAQSTERSPRYGELDKAAVVAAVMRLAQADSVEKVTMRAIAAELEASAASLYHHLPSKQELLDLVAQEVLASIEIPTAGPWDEQLRTLYIRGRAAMLRVPGIAMVLQTRPLVPAGRALNAASMRMLLDAGISRAHAKEANALLYTHQLGSVALEHSYGPSSSAKTFEYGMDVILAGLKGVEQV